MINCISSKKAITSTKKKNQKFISKFIASQDYIYIFISPKIALSKKFKANILSNL